MKEPFYRHLSKSDIPVLVSEDQKITNKLIAGEYKGKKSMLPTESDLLIIWGKSKKNGEQFINIPSEFNTMLYLIKGSMRVKGYGLVDAENLLVFEKEGNAIEISFYENSQFLLLSGAAIHEKVSQSGSFVMNSQTEILEAMRDYQMGKMGVLIEEK